MNATAEPLAAELIAYLHENKDALFALLPLGPQEAREVLPGGETARPIPGADGRTHAPCIAKCGHAELACPTCQRTNIVVDGVGRFCLDCRRRPGEPAKRPDSRKESPPSPLRRHHLGEISPSHACPVCGHGAWREAIYSWACRRCGHVEMKP